MRLDQIATATLSHLLGGLLRRVVVAAVMVIFAVVGVYQFSVAGTLELGARVGDVNAHLIVGAIYAALALASLITLWAIRSRETANAPPALTQPREMQIAMLIEAVMLGYTLARKNERAH